ncbi:MAG: FtsX-like permease family protein [Planctomycetes bacterium]|nr:FtsX-like permease family protein [Planctomycetota bacterium]
MRSIRTVKTAVNALRRNVMRAVLTTLGIIIGIAAVIAMMEIGQGSSLAIQQTIAGMGANNLSVRAGTASSGGISFGAGSVMTLTPQDAEAIAQNCPAVSNVAPVVRARTQVVYSNRNWVPMFIYGTTPNFIDVKDFQVVDGGMFTDRDVRNSSKVCVLGQTLVRELFGGASPIGKEIRLKNVGFRVIGVLGPKGANMMGFDQDDVVLAPWSTIKYRVVGSSVSETNQSSGSAGADSLTQVNTLNNLYPGSTALYPERSATQAADTPLPVRFTNVDEINVEAASSGKIDQAIDQISTLLRDRHRIRPGEPDDFSVRNMTEMVETLASTTTLMTNLLLGVALISLIVGGVGIMNIMLVSVTERTREIGLRMAVGARGADILRQFLVEAVMLCLAGGAMGILLGRGASYLVAALLHWPTATSLPAVIAAVSVSAVVGIVFGFYPAWKASRLDPIEALRFE